MSLYSSSNPSTGLPQAESVKHDGETMYNKMGDCLDQQGVSQDQWHELSEEDRAVWMEMAKYYRPYDGHE